MPIIVIVCTQLAPCCNEHVKIIYYNVKKNLKIAHTYKATFILNNFTPCKQDIVYVLGQLTSRTFLVTNA